MFDIIQGRATLFAVPEADREVVKAFPLFYECEGPQALRICGQEERLVILGLGKQFGPKRAQHGLFGG
jgi:hypothetical protein